MSLRDEVFQVFRSLSIDDVRDNYKLGDDLAVDSQEIVSLTCELEKTFRILIPEDVITRKSTVSDVVELVAGALSVRSPQPAEAAGANPLDGSLSEELVINAPVDIVYGCLFNMSDWPRLLPHVDAIDVVYDDGRYQEFFMTVRGADGHIIKVRSIRRCLDNEITFFQPDPPRFLKRHSGGWTFTTTGWGRCLVRTRHEWTLNDQAVVLYPAQNGQTTNQRVETLLRDHARLALTSWKSIVEEGKQYGAGAGTNQSAVTARV